MPSPSFLTLEKLLAIAGEPNAQRISKLTSVIALEIRASRTGPQRLVGVYAAGGKAEPHLARDLLNEDIARYSGSLGLFGCFSLLNAEKFASVLGTTI